VITSKRRSISAAYVEATGRNEFRIMLPAFCL
jgi:hypothetical protein